jgi:hypothetical protein
MRWFGQQRRDRTSRCDGTEADELTELLAPHDLVRAMDSDVAAISSRFGILTTARRASWLMTNVTTTIESKRSLASGTSSASISTAAE